METVAVVGASLAGLRAVETLRREGFSGRLVVVGAESHLPYDRPPLSKDFLTGDVDADDLALRSTPYEELGAEWMLGRRAVGLDLDTRSLLLDRDERVMFDGLVIATGSTPRKIPGQPVLTGLRELRTLDDATALRDRLARTPRRVVVVGAGFIGAEIAAGCRARGLEVAVLEMLPQPMVRGLGERLGAVLANLHRDHGVDLRTSTSIDDFIEDDDAVAGVVLADGSTIEADVVLVAIGVAPATKWLEGSGLSIDNGVVCDETCLAAPGVVAAGDVARWPNPRFDGEMMRLEHWTNATEQGVHAATRLLAGDTGTPFAPVPFVWSDQYDVKIQTVGRFAADDEMEVVSGALDDYRFLAIFGRDGQITGAMAFSDPRRLVFARRLIADRTPWDDARAAAREW